ncbi:MAG: T9SS type A sorting domain-containing protein [Janthinobacterium lividum]
MRSFLRLPWLLALLLVLGNVTTAHASHLLGGDITYTPVLSTTAGVPRYHVVIRRVLNAAIADGALAVTLNATLGACGTPGAGSFSVSAPRLRLLDGSVMGCGGPATPVYQVAIHEVDIDLPAGQWVLSFTEPARANGIQNITNAGAFALYLSAYLDNSTGTTNSSPKFGSIGLSYNSAAAIAPLSLAAFDADGDSLRYELISPAAGCNQPLAGTLTPHFGLHAGTGQLTPMTGNSTQGVYNVTVKVSEYRRTNGRWVLIGYVVRESLYYLYATTNQPPTFTTMQVGGGAAQSLSTLIAAQPGQTVTVALQATDPDAGQAIRFVSEALAVVPGLSLTRIGTTNAAQLTWQVPATLPPGRYSIPVAVFDDGCPFNASEERTLVFVVGSTALAARAGSTATAEVYPTPFREQVQFKTVPNQVVVLFDALGREVARLTSAADGRVHWQPASSLPAGLYLVRSAADGQPLARLLRAE